MTNDIIESNHIWEENKMSKYDIYRQENKKISESIIKETKAAEKTVNDIKTNAERTSRAIDRVNIIIGDADAQFEKATKLKGLDITLLFVATAMQCVRQYVIGKIMHRTNDQDAAKRMPGYKKGNPTERKHRWYNPSIEEIMQNPVPFDTTFGSPNFDLGIGGGFEHRAKTLGHDPLLGWIFGTGNIATSTLTTHDFRTFHVLTGNIATGAARDKISYNASTFKMLSYTANKLLCEGMEGKKKVGLSIMQEAIHLGSDINSKKSLPIPIVSTVSVQAAKNLANFGIDMGSIVKVSGQAGFAVLINSLIGMFHGLFYDEAIHGSWNLYSVKTRKILSYSDLIASTSNIIITALTRNVELLDIGGIIVTIKRIITDRKFITDIKKEFIEKEWQKALDC